MGKMELTFEKLRQMSEPFPDEVIEWKPGATNKEKTKALALAYVEVRHYIERLNTIFGPNWSDDYEFIKSGMPICRLTICGVTRADIGEKGEADVNTETSAIAQSFKRACVKFGLGLHLYREEKLWVAYDAQRKSFTPQALAQLTRKPPTRSNSNSDGVISKTGETSPSGAPDASGKELTHREKLVLRIYELNEQLGRNIDHDWLHKSATEAELTAFGMDLRKELNNAQIPAR